MKTDDNAGTTVKQRNRIALLTMLYRGDPATKQDIARQINLSLPTVTENLNALEEQGLVIRAELQESTGGRKPQTFTFNSQHFLAIGVAMRSTELVVQAIDLHGNTIMRRRRQIPFHNEASYYRRVGTLVEEFAAEVEKKGSHVLGVAIAISGTVSVNGPELSVASDAEWADRNLPLATIAQVTQQRCILVRHDEAEAMAELWHDPTIDDAAYISVGPSVNSAVIVDGTLHRRRQPSNAGTIGHMTLVRDGLMCSCGNRGCVNAYCSLPMLPEEGESLPGFFSVLEQGEVNHRHRLNEWFDNLAQAIANMRSVIPMDIIVGGQAAHYLDDDDIATLYSRVNAIEHNDPSAPPAFRMRRSLNIDEQDVIGAALVLVREYLDHPYRICQ
ncbi:ROK family transcriptional regulator [Bifidobacterium choloepi]|nr:ROK family transcriptional regulator [Bifidobacterium choloepi]